MLILLFTTEIWTRMYLECKRDLISKALACSAEACCFLQASEAHSCWRLSWIFLEQSLFTCVPVATPGENDWNDEWRGAPLWWVSAQSWLVSREVRRGPETWELLWTGDGNALFSWYALLLLRMKFLEVVRDWSSMGNGIWKSFQA